MSLPEFIPVDDFVGNSVEGQNTTESSVLHLSPGFAGEVGDVAIVGALSDADAGSAEAIETRTPMQCCVSVALDKLIANGDRAAIPVGLVAGRVFGGVRVPDEQFKEFTAALKTDPRVEFRKDGRLMVRPAATGTEDRYADDNQEMFYDPGHNPREFTARNGGNMTSKEIRRAMKAIDFGPEVKQARKRAKGGSGQRRGGKHRNVSVLGTGGVKSRYKALSQGHQKTLDELIEDMNNK